MRKYNNYKKQYKKDQQTIKSLHKLYRKPLLDNVIDKKDYETLGSIFTRYVDERKYEPFLYTRT